MQGNIETPEQKRERLKQQELKSNPMANMNDAFNRLNSSAPDVGSLGWKATGVIILVIIVCFIIASLIIR